MNDNIYYELRFLADGKEVRVSGSHDRALAHSLAQDFSQKYKVGVSVYAVTQQLVASAFEGQLERMDI